MRSLALPSSKEKSDCKEVYNLCTTEKTESNTETNTSTKLSLNESLEQKY